MTWTVTGASVIKCCYAATGMYVTAAAALLRGLANTRTSLSHQTTRRRDTKSPEASAAAWQAPPASPASASRVRTSAPHAAERSCSSNVATPGALRACPARAHGTASPLAVVPIGRRSQESISPRSVRDRGRVSGPEIDLDAQTACAGRFLLYIVALSVLPRATRALPNR